MGEGLIHSAWSMHVTGMTVAPPPPPPATTWRGLTVAPEVRCAPYDSDDYRYPQSVERDIVRDLGGIYSPYTCESFDSIRETDIEHIVARSEAHDSGLCRADAETRTRFARDLLNLTLASPGLNRREKVAHDAADWLPDQNRCWFAQRVVDVRREYGLTIDQAEAEALDEILTTCQSFEISCDLTRPPPVAAHPPIQAFPNCNAMREAGWTRGVNRDGGTYQEAWDDAEKADVRTEHGARPRWRRPRLRMIGLRAFPACEHADGLAAPTSRYPQLTVVIIALVAITCSAHEAVSQSTYIIATGRRLPYLYAISLDEAPSLRRTTTPRMRSSVAPRWRSTGWTVSCSAILPIWS